MNARMFSSANDIAAVRALPYCVEVCHGGGAKENAQKIALLSLEPNVNCRLGLFSPLLDRNTFQHAVSGSFPITYIRCNAPGGCWTLSVLTIPNWFAPIGDFDRQSRYCPKRKFTKAFGLLQCSRGVLSIKHKVFRVLSSRFCPDVKREV